MVRVGLLLQADRIDPVVNGSYKTRLPESAA